MAGRLKARLATNAADQELHKHLAVAKSALTRALEICAQASRTRNSSDPVAATVARRARDYKEVLAKAIRDIDRIGYITPSHVEAAPRPLSPAEVRQARHEERQRRERERHKRLYGGEVIWVEDLEKPQWLEASGDDEDEVDLGEGGIGDDELGDN